MTSPPAALRLLPVAWLLAAALILGAGGCGGEGSAAPGSATAHPSPTQLDGAHRSGPALTSVCPRQLDAFVASLAGLRRRLAVGLSYEQYVAAVRNLRAAYEGIPIRRLTLACLAIGRPTERALNEHIDAANAWGECLADTACTMATIEPVLQRKWRVASHRLSEVE